MTTAKSITLRCRYYRLFPPEQPLGTTEEELSLGLDNTAFLLVDVHGKGLDENYFSERVPQTLGSREMESRERILPNIAAARKAAKAFGFPIIYVTNYLAPSTTVNSEFRRLALRTRNHDILQSWQETTGRYRFSRLIAPEEGDYQFRKQHFSGFYDTPLESLLKELGTRNLVATGYDSRICLGMTVVDALYRNYRVVVLRDCVRTQEYVETEQEGWANWMAIRFIEAHVGYTATSEDFIRACEARK